MEGDGQLPLRFATDQVVPKGAVPPGQLRPPRLRRRSDMDPLRGNFRSSRRARVAPRIERPDVVARQGAFGVGGIVGSSRTEFGAGRAFRVLHAHVHAVISRARRRGSVRRRGGGGIDDQIDV